MKAFRLEPTKLRMGKTDVALFLSILESRGYGFDPISFEETQTPAARTNPSTVIDMLISNLEEADLIFSTGSFFFLNYLSGAPEFQNLLVAKLDEGTPFIFELPRIWHRIYDFYNTITSPEIGDLLKACGIMPTPIRVHSKDRSSSVAGDASFYVRASDGCFLNADILGKCDSICVSHANLLTLELGSYPVAEAGPLHYFVDENDLSAKLPLGQRPCLIAERRSEKMHGFVVAGGGFISEGYNAAAGYIPGAELNIPAVESIVDRVRKNSDSARSRASKAYEALFDIENSLGRVLEARLPRHKTALLKQAYLQEIVDETSRSWEEVSDLFLGLNRVAFLKTFSWISSNVRRAVAHPVKLTSTASIDENQLLRINGAAKIALAAASRLTHPSSAR